MARNEAAGVKRRHQDVIALSMGGYEIEVPNEDRMDEFYLKFEGPKDTPYEGGQWKVYVTLPADYPFKSPSIGFKNRMFHPNVDETSGSVCLDVINQTWSPMFNLVNIFDSFLPQLLAYPNPADPLNGEAASLLLRDPPAYAQRIKDHVRTYASAAVGFASESVGGSASTPVKPGRSDVSGTSPGSVSQVGQAAAEDDDSDCASEMSDEE